VSKEAPHDRLACFDTRRAALLSMTIALWRKDSQSLTFKPTKASLDFLHRSIDMSLASPIDAIGAPAA